MIYIIHILSIMYTITLLHYSNIIVMIIVHRRGKAFVIPEIICADFWVVWLSSYYFARER
jgi:hypothetical protein